MCLCRYSICIYNSANWKTACINNNYSDFESILRRSVPACQRTVNQHTASKCVSVTQLNARSCGFLLRNPLSQDPDTWKMCCAYKACHLWRASSKGCCSDSLGCHGNSSLQGGRGRRACASVQLVVMETDTAAYISIHWEFAARFEATMNSAPALGWNGDNVIERGRSRGAHVSQSRSAEFLWQLHVATGRAKVTFKGQNHVILNCPQISVCVCEKLNWTH